MKVGRRAESKDKGVIFLEDRVSAVLQKVGFGGKKPFLIAIDGRCAAGKTTLAAGLQAETGCAVIHMDHFFLRPGQRTVQRLQEPGGNVDYERFREEVMLPLGRGQGFGYRPYDCKKGELTSGIWVEPGEIAVVEGSYSCHPVLWAFYDLRVFLDVEAGEQLRRIRIRGGEEALARFREQWIPLEERYFAAFEIQKRCDLVLR